jgi:hypothetical protein
LAITFIGSDVSQGTSSAPATGAHGLTILSGDVLVVAINKNDSSNIVFTENNGSTPFDAGYAEGYGVDTGGAYCVRHRVAGGSEPSSYAWTISASERWAVLLLQFRGVDTTTPWDIAPAVATRQEGSSGTPTAPAMTTTVADTMGLILICVDKSNADVGSPPSNSYADEVVTGTSQLFGSHRRLWASPGDTGTTTQTYNASGDGYAIFQVALKPATSGYVPYPVSQMSGGMGEMSGGMR